METQAVIDLGYEAILVTLKIAAPALLSIMIMGIIVSVLQAATQISEQTLSFIPKIIAMSLALLFSGSWILRTMLIFTSNIFKKISNLNY